MKNIHLYCFFLIFFTVNAVRISAQNAETEPNNNFGQANPINLSTLNASLKGTINGLNDQDFFKFTTPGPCVVTGRVIDVPANINMQLTLFDENQNKISETNYYVNAGQIVVYEQLVWYGGTFYIRLRDAGDDGSNPAQYTFNLGLDTTDVYEWNQDFASAKTIPHITTFKASIRSAGDQDYFKFTIPKSGVITGRVTDVPPNINLQMTLFDENQNRVSETNYYVNAGQVINYEQLVPYPGTYYVRLRDAGDDGSNPAQYTFALGFDETDAYEWNQEFASAKTIPHITTLKASIRSGGDQDFFKFIVPKSGVITGRVIDVPSNINMQLTLFDENQNRISETNYYVNAGQIINYEQLVSVGGIYYVRLRDAGDDGSNSGQYTFSLGFDDTDKYEWNHDFNTASQVQCGDVVFASIRSAGDQDYFKIASNPGTISVNVVNVPSNINLQVTLFNPDQEKISESNYYVNAGVNVNYSQQVDVAGTYYLRVRDAGDDGSNAAQYKLTFACPIFVPTWEHPDALKTTMFPTPTTGLLYFSETVDRVLVRNALGQTVATATQTDQIDLSPLEAAGIYLVYLYKGDKLMLAQRTVLQKQ